MTDAVSALKLAIELEKQALENDGVWALG